MIFNSFQFIWLFPLIFIVYWATDIAICKDGEGKKIANWLLILISYGVYAQWSFPYTLILFGITFETYIFALLIEHKEAYRRKKYIIWMGVLLALTPLIVFKYFNFVTHAGPSALA